MSAPIIIGCRCSRAATSRRSRISSPSNVTDFASNSILLDFTCGRDNPALPYVGNAIRDECGLDEDVRTIADVPSRSLLSRLTDHYLQIIANRAPIGFEAEFVNQRGENICYRGILMPFSSDGDAIDFIYGVINWKTVGAHALAEPVATPEPEPVADEPVAEEITEEIAESDLPNEHLVWEDGPLDRGAGRPSDAEADEPRAAGGPVRLAGTPADEDEIDEIAEILVEPDAGLADRLWAARETAEAAKSADGRTRAALYRALSLAYDFAVTAQANPEDYAELLEESGVKAQARAPMTPIVKLVFGIDYDKARLTEFAAALAWADRQQIALGGFEALIDRSAGRPQGAGRGRARGAPARAARRHTRRSGRARSCARPPPISLDAIAGGRGVRLVDHPPQCRRPSRGRRDRRRSRDRRTRHPPRRSEASRGLVTAVRAGL